MNPGPNSRWTAIAASMIRRESLLPIVAHSSPSFSSLYPSFVFSFFRVFVIRFLALPSNPHHRRAAQPADQMPHFQHAERGEHLRHGQAAGGDDRVDRAWPRRRSPPAPAAPARSAAARPDDGPTRPSSRGVASTSGPSSSSTSSAVSTSFAPSRIRRWQPREVRLSTRPGTANTSRPCSMACRAVISAPAAVARLDHDHPQRQPADEPVPLRKGAGQRRGPGRRSLSSAPWAATSSASLSCSGG